MAFAANFDRRKLLKDSLDTLMATLIARRDNRQRMIEAERLEQIAQAQEQKRLLELENRAVRHRRDYLLPKAFSHWLESTRFQRRAIEDAHRLFDALRLS